MRYLISLVLCVSLFGCKSDKKSGSITTDMQENNSDIYEPLESEKSSDDENYQAALDFLNSYIENKDRLEILEFVKASSLATESLKKELETILIRGWEEDPQVGLGFDPLFDAQDFPDKGVELYSFDQKTGYVMVQGIEWNDFRVAMQVVKVNGHILVNGCGVVNIPVDKRAER